MYLLTLRQNVQKLVTIETAKLPGLFRRRSAKGPAAFVCYQKRKEVVTLINRKLLMNQRTVLLYWTASNVHV